MTALATRQETIGDYVLSITTRNDGGSSVETMAELTFRTIVAYLWIVDQLERGITRIDVESVEARLAKDKDIKFEEQFGDPRVTVWDSYRGNKNPNFHLNSSDIPQDAINMWLANTDAIARAKAKYNVITPPAAPASAQTSAAANTPRTVETTPIAGVIAATLAPTPSTPQYAPGQQVSFHINRIVASTNKGSPIYQLWGELGQKYPLVTVYQYKPNSKDYTSNYQQVRGVIEKLGLSLNQPEVSGSWFLVCRVAHGKDGKEYMNCELLEAVEAVS